MNAPTTLSRSALACLPARLGRPAYDPAALRTGIVHIGVGGFHRAHMAVYTDDLMASGADTHDWGITGVGLMPADRRIRDALAPQDFLYTVVERQDDDESARVIGVLKDMLIVEDSPPRVLETLDDPAVRIVSLTVTPHGYGLNPATRSLDPASPAIAHDLAHPTAPRSAVGLIVEALRRRRDAGAGAFTALSCDNIPHNGQVLKDAVLALSRLRDPDLAEWIATHAAFPNSMVDRITPTTTPAQIEDLEDRFGVSDAWPVFCERFRQWVVEDDFVAGRPAWEEVGVQFVPDVAPYEFMKLRLLNGSHLAIAGLGRLCGYTLVDETMRDEGIHAYMRALMDRETGPTLPAVPGVDLEAYKVQLLSRFANRRIRDTVDRVNADAPVGLLVDPIRDRLRTGEPVGLLSLGLAAWMRRMTGRDDAGAPIDIIHPQRDLLLERAVAGGPDPRPLLAVESIFGDLGAHDGFVACLGEWLNALHVDGAARTLTRARSVFGF